jgi:hypothetical protein
MITPVHSTTIVVSNQDAALAFYFPVCPALLLWGRL